MAKVIKENQQPWRDDPDWIVEKVSQTTSPQGSLERTERNEDQALAKRLYMLVMGIGITILIVGLCLIPNPSGYDSRGDSNAQYILIICFPIGLWTSVILILTYVGYHGSPEAWERRKKRRPLVLKIFGVIILFFLVWIGLVYGVRELPYSTFSYGFISFSVMASFGLPVTFVCLGIYLFLYRISWWKMDGGKKNKGRTS
jgi:hypothetical protein